MTPNLLQRLLALAGFLMLALPALASTPVILSTDVGNEIDDQWAIAYLLTQPAFDTLGIISAHAPSLPAPSAHATYLVLKDEVENRLGLTVHPPLFEGSSLPLPDGKTPRPNAGVDFILSESRRFNRDHRLNLVVIGAATDAASALLIDPTLADRIRVIAMAFKSAPPSAAREYNEENDPEAWRVLLRSGVPITVGSGDVCTKYLSLSYKQAQDLLRGHGPVADWLWEEYQAWYYRNVKPLRVDDFSRSWVIWDIITLAYLQDMATVDRVPRPALSGDMSLTAGDAKDTIEWIKTVDSERLWPSFLAGLDAFERTHAIAAPHTPAAE